MKVIDADALMTDICDSIDKMTEVGIPVDGEWLWAKLNHAIKHAPTIEQERKKGKWRIKAINTYDLAYGSTGYEPVYECSVCGLSTESYLRLDEPIMPEDASFPRFCPNCGADMRGEKK